MSKSNVHTGIKNIFTYVTRERCMTNFKRMIKPSYGTKPIQKVSVLVPLCKVAQVPSLLYTVRASTLRKGEVAFPGGKADEGEDCIETALRETYEEIGLNAEKVDVWGKGPAVPGRNNSIMITPVVASIGDVSQDDLKINEQEVSEVFTIPIEELCEPKNQYYTQFKNGFILPVFVVEDYKICGMTAYITHAFLNSTLPTEIYRNECMKKKVVTNKL